MSNVSESQDNCVVCFKNVEIYSIGECDHPVCYECSARMRVLCEKNECMICRRDCSKVIFSRDILPYTVLDKQIRSGYYEKKHRICFANNSIQQAYYRLLENRCYSCKRVFHSFDQLKEHVRKIHELYYCDLCTEHLKIFNSERRCYSRTDLATHRRKGDVDDTSHRGHPICDYCELRFLDKDELFRHLRREHYFCHFCDADGNNLFYINYDALRDHFKNSHFLCEEADCAQEQFTAVFRTEIDLKAHRASAHGKSLSKLAVRQTRTLELEFAFTPRNRNNGYGDNSRGGGHRRGHNNDNQAEEPEPEPVVQKPVRIDARNEEDFPSLGNGGGASLTLASNMRPVTYGQAGLARTKENFPALGGNLNSGASANSKKDTGPIPSNSKSNKPSASAMLKTPLPSSSGASSSKGSKGGSTNRPATGPKKELNVNEFPALPTNKGGKKNKNLNLMEDMVTPNVSTVNVNLVPAKHRALLDDYVSITTRATKINLVKKDDMPTENKTNVVPKLNSVNNFPTLGESSTGVRGSDPPVWIVNGSANKKIKGNKNQEITNTKKVAPAPDIFGENLKKSSKTTANTENSKKNAENNTKNNKKLPDNTKTINQQKPDNSQTDTKKQQNQKKNKKSPMEEESNERKQQNDAKSTKRQNTSEVSNKENESAMRIENASVPGPPPGFSSMNTGNKIKYPPPGFGTSISVNSVARNLNNLTFTNSMGEDFSVPANSQSYSFLPLPDNQKRNQALFSEFQKALTTQDALKEFVSISQMFREGDYYPSAFYDHCKIVLGDRFDDIFPELLVLLPDIPKQQSLFLVYSQDQNTSNKSKKSKKHRLEVCATCKQILLSEDLIAHVQSHTLEHNFPILSENSTSAAKSSWKN